MISSKANFPGRVGAKRLERNSRKIADNDGATAGEKVEVEWDN